MMAQSNKSETSWVDNLPEAPDLDKKTVAIFISKKGKKKPFAKIEGIQEGGPARPGAGTGQGSGNWVRKPRDPERAALLKRSSAAFPAKKKVKLFSGSDEIEIKLREKDAAFSKHISVTPVDANNPEETMGQKGISETRKVRLSDGSKYCFKIPRIDEGGGRANCILYGEISKILGLEVTPPVIRTQRIIYGKMEQGVATKWLDNYDSDKGNYKPTRDSLDDAALVNIITGIIDTHPGNWKVDLNKKLWMVDTDWALWDNPPRGSQDGAFSLTVSRQHRIYDDAGFARVEYVSKPLSPKHSKSLDRLIKNEARLRDLFIREFAADNISAASAERRFDGMMFRARRLKERGRL